MIFGWPQPAARLSAGQRGERRPRDGKTRPGGRLSTRTLNTIVGEIGRLHDAQFDDTDAERRLGGLSPHDARHTFAYRLSKESGHNGIRHNRAELESPVVLQYSAIGVDLRILDAVTSLDAWTPARMPGPGAHDQCSWLSG